MIAASSIAKGVHSVQTYHWNEKRKTEEYYEELDRLPDKQ